MFKKLKDKLAEEVKSSPQRIQQIAQAAQAAVTSASSSISDITNNDLFSIGDSDGQQTSGSKVKGKPLIDQSKLQDVSLEESITEPSSGEPMDHSIGHESVVENQRQRRLSNSSFASDVSFRLPSYESPSMYHLQSDMDVSASEAESFSNSTVSLDRVTKEQLYSAYRRTQDRYSKYRTQYADLARHYKLLERENAKARSVLVETQDKALRRISELREQCSLEQSAKAHLEKALRVEIDERNIKIETLETKVKLLVENKNIDENTKDGNKQVDDNNANLITLENDKEHIKKENNADYQVLQGKIEKLEQLLNKYKESLKSAKEKNSQFTSELQILNVELEQRNKTIEEKNLIVSKFDEAKVEIQKLQELNEELQNKIKTHEFSKIKENSTLQADLQKALEEIKELQAKIVIFTKREEENAISLAENKLSIHKELESKEAEIKSLKDSLSASNQEVQSLNIVINDYKNNIAALEEERSKQKNNINELNSIKSKVPALEAELQELTKKCQTLEQFKSKADEEYKCLQLQLKQETAEKLAMKDRNMYLENRNQQLTEENTKKSSQIQNYETELQGKENDNSVETQNTILIDEINTWKAKYEAKETEIQEEREELGKLQSEIEKLLTHHELIRQHNSEINDSLNQLKHQNNELTQEIAIQVKTNQSLINNLSDIKNIKEKLNRTRSEFLKLRDENSSYIKELSKPIAMLTSIASETTVESDLKANYEKIQLKNKSILEELNTAINSRDSQKKEITDLRKQIDQLKKKISTVTEDAQEKELNFNNLLSEYKIAIQDLKVAKEEKEEFTKAIDKNKSETILLHEETNNLKTKLLQAENETEEIKAKLKHVESNQKKVLENVLASSKNENEELFKQIEEYKSKFDKLKAEQIDTTQLLLTVVSEENQKKESKLKGEIMLLQEETNNLKTKLLQAEKETEEIKAKLRNVESDYKKALENDLASSKNETKELLKQIEEYKCKFDKLQDEHIDTNHKLLSAVAEINQVIEKKECLASQIKELENKNSVLLSEIDELRSTGISFTKNLEVLTHQKEDMEKSLKELSNLQRSIKVLEEDKKALSDENMSLRNQYEFMTNSFEGLESEINELKKSHVELEKEKDHLNAIITTLENNVNSKIETVVGTVSVQTDLENVNEAEEHVLALKKELAHLTDINKEIEIEILSLKGTNEQLSSKIIEQNLRNNDDIANEFDLAGRYDVLIKENDTLKEENKRFKSDIEGLQAYLTKISKENGLLNDKLREMIATSETFVGKNDLENSNDHKEQIDACNDKIAELSRENTLLLEENLELKDQLQSQSYPVRDISVLSSEKNNEIDKKYEHALNAKKILESKLDELEQANRIINTSMEQSQQHNEKLRITNQKLETRLDEALVSLRHLHALQENTELEYLKNILYEYLTGPGNHSVTLAKVIAAVVKFDDSQTQMILQKEKERQGFLRQLGLL